MFNKLITELSSSPNCRIIFLDVFENVIIRNANDVSMLWAKFMIRELGLELQIKELYLLRRESETYLAETLEKETIEIPYDKLIAEVHTRLICTNQKIALNNEGFADCFRKADYKAETMSQKLDKSAYDSFKKLKEKGYVLYGVSNFRGSTALLKNCLEFHDLNDVIAEVFASSDLGLNKQKIEVYINLLNRLNTNIEHALIFTTIDKNELLNSKNNGIPIIQISKKQIDKKQRTTKSEQKKYRKIVRELYRDCNKRNAPPHSDYIMFYYVYIERLYRKAKKDGIKNIFFLAREGLFLKKLFDHYQKNISINEGDNINAHYFKASRNSLMLASFKDLQIEEFEYLRRRWPNLSVKTFLKNFNFSEKIINEIVERCGFTDVQETVLENFLDSEIFDRLKKSPYFIEAYDETRNSQKKYFETYLNSFDVDIWSEGFHLADVGWGGTMQNRLYAFFEEKVKVHGYYLGVREINNIRESTIKYGLNFSVYPYITFYDHILMANIELNEQLLAAGHGSTIAYTDSSNGFTIEHHEKNDKRIYDKFIGETQNFMFDRFVEITRKFEDVCYDYDLEQYEMVDHALRIGLFASKRKVAREVDIYKGFYQNVGNFSVGLALGENFGDDQKKELIKNFFLYPELAFRYVLRFKPMLMRKNYYFLSHFIPSYFIYHYIKMRCHKKGLKP